MNAVTANREQPMRAFTWLVAMLLLAVTLDVSSQEALTTEDDPTPGRVEQSLDPFRRGAHILAEPAPPPMANVQNQDLRRQRGWPEQPPTIPHTIDGYQLDKNSNRCMLCHSRRAVDQFQAPMISVTHYMDRNGQVLAQLSPRRWFCTQCHVVQSVASPVVENTFTDVEELLDRPRSQ